MLPSRADANSFVEMLPSRVDTNSCSETLPPSMRPDANVHFAPQLCLSHIDRVIMEIVETERTYVKDLREIIEGYLQPIMSSVIGQVSSKTSSLSRSVVALRLCTIADVFGNLEDVHHFNSNFLSQLEKCGLDPVAISACFVENSSGFDVYTQYCTNYSRTVSLLTDLLKKKETAEMFKGRQMALKHNLPLSSYLLKPVQRILKYHLLLQNILSHTESENEGYPAVQNALTVMINVASHINDMKRIHEHAVRVQEMHSLLYRCVKWLLLKLRN